MNILNEGRHTGEYLIAEAPGTMSREEIVVVQTGAAVPSGTVLGKITASGKYAPYSNAAVNGSEVAAGVLYSSLPAFTGDKDAVAHVRLAEVSAVELTGSDAAGVADLKALTILVR